MAVVGHGSENLFLEDTAFMGEAKGQAEIARSIVGRTRVNYEVLTGTNPFTDEQPASPRNPQGTLGHDHSGPPWGSAFLHPVVWWGWNKADATNVIRPRLGSSEFYEDTISASTNGITFGPMVFWNRQHAPLPDGPTGFGRPPYSILALVIAAHKKSADADLDIRLIVGDDERVFSDTVTITSTATTAYTVDSGGDIANGNPPALYMPATGGRNKFTLEFTSTALAANAITIDGWSLCVLRKRRWVIP